MANERLTIENPFSETEATNDNNQELFLKLGLIDGEVEEGEENEQQGLVEGGERILKESEKKMKGILEQVAIEKLTKLAEDNKLYLIEEWIEETFDIDDNGVVVTKANIQLSTIYESNNLDFSFMEINHNLYLNSLRSAEHLILPDHIGGSVNLNSLTSTKDLKLHNNIEGKIYLEHINYEEKEELRKKYPKLKII